MENFREFNEEGKQMPREEDNLMASDKGNQDATDASKGKFPPKTGDTSNQAEGDRQTIEDDLRDKGLEGKE